MLDFSGYCMGMYGWILAAYVCSWLCRSKEKLLKSGYVDILKANQQILHSKLRDK